MFNFSSLANGSRLKGLLGLISSLFFAFFAIPSHAQTRARIILDPTHTYQVTNDRTDRTMEVGGGGNLYNEGGVDMWDYWGGANQQWQFEPTHSPNDGVYVIRNRDTKKVLTFNRYSNTDPSASGSVSQASVPANGPSDTQQWIIESNGSFSPPALGYKAIQCRIRLYFPNSSVSTGLEQTDWGVVQSLIANSYSSGYNLWDFKDVSTNSANDYTASAFQIINSNSGKALTLEPGDMNDRSVKQMTAWGLSCEEWRFVPSTTTSGYYYIVSRRTGLILEIGGGNTDNGASLNAWDNYQHPWQEWAFLDINDSHILQPNEFTDGRTFKIYSRHAGKVIEIGGGERNDGARANMWNDFSHPWQQWHMQFSAANRMAAPTPAPSKSTLPTAAAPSSLEVYPNPVTTKLHLVGPTGFDVEHATLMLTTADGRQVMAPYQAGQLDVSSLSSGLYFLTVTSGSQTYRQKFSKK